MTEQDFARLAAFIIGLELVERARDAAQAAADSGAGVSGAGWALAAPDGGNVVSLRDFVQHVGQRGTGADLLARLERAQNDLLLLDAGEAGTEGADGGADDRLEGVVVKTGQA